MLRTKCITMHKQETNGTRISVMSQHTLNDGITPNPAITNDLFDIHCPELGPPLELIGAYYKRGLPWEEFADQYQAYLRSIGKVVLGLAEQAYEEDITLLCIEPTPKNCHRRLLAKHCQSLIPDIKLIVG